jgi:hypothetical protein
VNTSGKATLYLVISLFMRIFHFLPHAALEHLNIFHLLGINTSSKRTLLTIMMTNQLPHPDATIPAILDFLATSHRYGLRNRCLYRLRLVLPYRDITELRLGDILTRQGTIVDTIHGEGWSLRVDAGLARDLLSYARERCGRYDLTNIFYLRGSERLFTTQKSPSFSPGWLAQLYTHLDRSLQAHFLLTAKDA